MLGILDDEKLIEGARTKGAALTSMLQKLADDFPTACEGARGQGLLQGLILKPGFVARDVLPKLTDAGVLLTAAGERVIRFSPPLVVSIAELEEGVRVLRGVIAELAVAAAGPVKTTAAAAHI